MKRKISKTAKLDYIEPEADEIGVDENIVKKHLDPSAMFTQFTGSKQELQNLIADNWSRGWVSEQKAPTEISETWVVPLPPDKFYSGVININEGSELTAEFTKAHSAQGFRKRIRVKSPNKPKADWARAMVTVSKKPFAVVANFNVLTLAAGLLEFEGQDPDTFKEPISPQTLMYNRYDSNNKSHSPEEFDKLLEKAFHYWKNKAMWAPTEKPNPTNELIQMANRLDQKGLKKEADFLDEIIKKATGELITLDDRRPKKESIPSLGIWVDSWGPATYEDIWFFESNDNRDEGLFDYDDISEYPSLKKINLENHPELIQMILSYLSSKKSE